MIVLPWGCLDEVYRYYRQMPELVKIIITEHVREYYETSVRDHGWS